LAAILFTLRLAAPPNLLDQDQERPGNYVLDVLKNGNWICQRDLTGDITSKPPFYTWLSALVALAGGRVSLFALYLPGALAAAGTAQLVLWSGARHFGRRAGFFGAAAVLVCGAGLKEVGLARTDGVFAFTVTVAALLAYRAWISGRGWVWFWLVAAVATLTKGPLGPLLAAEGLFASFWERKSAHPWPIRGGHALGFGLFLVITAGWFGLAWLYDGPAVAAKLLGKELIGHTITEARDHIPGVQFYQPPLFYLARAAPWSVLGYLGLWRVWRRPTSEAPERRFERFLFCWFLIGLVIFSLQAHQRSDLLWPIMPAAALLAGRELDLILAATDRRRVGLATAAGLAMGVAGFGAYYFGPHARTPLVRQTVALRAQAAAIEGRGADEGEFPLTHVDDPLGLQIYLNTWCRPVSPERAAELLRGVEPAFVAVKSRASLEPARRSGDPIWHTLLPATNQLGDSGVEIVSNQPGVRPAKVFAFCAGTIWVRVQDARLVQASEVEFCFAPGPQRPEVRLVNESAESRKLVVCVHRGQHRQRHEGSVGPGQAWTVQLGSNPETAPPEPGSVPPPR
jgi:hypothetical protein